MKWTKFQAMAVIKAMKLTRYHSFASFSVSNGLFTPQGQETVTGPMGSNISGRNSHTGQRQGQEQPPSFSILQILFTFIHKP